jgi:hypothetical protein
MNQWAKRMVDLATMDDGERAALQKKIAAKKQKKRKKPQSPGKRTISSSRI